MPKYFRIILYLYSFSGLWSSTQRFKLEEALGIFSNFKIKNGGNTRALVTAREVGLEIRQILPPKKFLTYERTVGLHKSCNNFVRRGRRINKKR